MHAHASSLKGTSWYTIFNMHHLRFVRGCRRYQKWRFPTESQSVSQYFRSPYNESTFINNRLTMRLELFPIGQNIQYFSPH